MVYCVVPYCSSRGKTPGVSFHEFPSDKELCSRWMKAISRKDWAPNSFSNSSRVCSKHFLDSDFKQCRMNRCLVKGAVPSVFPNYPKYMKPSPKFQRTLCSIEKRKHFCIQEKESDHKRSSPRIDMNSDAHKIIQEKESEHKRNTPGIDMNSDAHKSVKEEESDHKSSSPSIDMNSDAQKKLLFSCEDKETQADFLAKKTNTEINKHKLRASRYLKKIQTLQDELDNCKKELDELKYDGLVKCLKVILEDAEENVPKAVFIKDFILNYSRKSPSYSDMTIHHSSIWHSISATGYEYGRKDIGLNLPSRNILLNYAGDANNKEVSNNNSIVKKSIKVELEEISTMDGISS